MFLFVLADKARSGDLIARESVKIRDDVYNNNNGRLIVWTRFNGPSVVLIIVNTS